MFGAVMLKGSMDYRWSVLSAFRNVRLFASPQRRSEVFIIVCDLSSLLQLFNSLSIISLNGLQDKPQYCRLCTMSRKAMFGETAAYSNMSKSKSSSHRRHKRPNSSEKRGGKVSKVRNLWITRTLCSCNFRQFFI